jgi:hypothetical protein
MAGSLERVIPGVGVSRSFRADAREGVETAKGSPEPRLRIWGRLAGAGFGRAIAFSMSRASLGTVAREEGGRASCSPDCYTVSGACTAAISEEGAALRWEFGGRKKTN